MGSESKRSKELEFYGGDPRLLPNYSVHDVAHHLRQPASTVRAWVKASSGLIVPADGKGTMLSFQNLTEVHVLSMLRGYNLSTQKIRGAIEELREELSTEHPLAEVDLETDRRDIFAWVFGTLIKVTGNGRGQAAFRPVLARYLDRIERNPGGHLARLYPLLDGDKRTVVIDPLRKGGSPYLVSLGVETYALASRFHGGDSVEDLAADYGTTTEQILEALRYERAIAA